MYSLFLFIGCRIVGPFQTIDYVYYPNEDNDQNAFPDNKIHINSTIQKPLDMDILSH